MSEEEEIKSIIEKTNQYNPPVDLTNFKVASFLVRKPKTAKSTDLIIDIIQKSISEQSAITRDDIYRLYWLYKTNNETNEIPPSREYVYNEGWVNITFDRQSFINHWRVQRNAISWFKAALSSAILEGKLLVLPIIQI
jgi:hypothetical protein